MIELLTDAYFEYDEDSDADTYDTQETDFQTAARFYAASILGQRGDSLAAIVQDTLNRELWWHLKPDDKAAFHLVINGQEITVSKA